jgi:hypothetical protein
MNKTAATAANPAAANEVLTELPAPWNGVIGEELGVGATLTKDY